MDGARIISPVPKGSGAWVVHSMLERSLPGYYVRGFSPAWEFCPPLLPFAAPVYSADLIHAAPDHAFFLCRKSMPCVLTFHNYVLDRYMHSCSSIYQRVHYATDLRLWIKLALRAATRITAVSRFTAELVRQNLECARPIEIIYNGVDPESFAPAPAFESRRKEIRVFFSGNITQRKGAHFLPAIAQKLKSNIRIYYTQGLRTCKSLLDGPRLIPLGPIPHHRMPERYREMDMLLLPTYREGFSLAVLEAMASGLPVVASNCSSLPEQIDHGKGGFLCPVGDVTDFSDKISLLADSTKLRHEMGQYNRAQIEKHFTLDRMVEQYLFQFREALAAHGRHDH